MEDMRVLQQRGERIQKITTMSDIFALEIIDDTMSTIRDNVSAATEFGVNLSTANMMKTEFIVRLVDCLRRAVSFHVARNSEWTSYLATRKDVDRALVAASQEASALRQEVKKKEDQICDLQASLGAQRKRMTELEAEVKQVLVQGQALAHKLEKEVKDLEASHTLCHHKIDSRDAEISRLKEEQRVLVEGLEKGLLQASNENLALRESDAILRQRLGDVLDELTARNQQVQHGKNGFNPSSRRRCEVRTAAAAAPASSMALGRGPVQTQGGLTPQSSVHSSFHTPAYTQTDRRLPSRKPHSATSHIPPAEQGRPNPPRSTRMQSQPHSLTPHTNGKNAFPGLGFDMLLWEEHIRQVSVRKIEGRAETHPEGRTDEKAAG